MLAFFPNDTRPNDQAAAVGLVQAMLAFSSIFSPVSANAHVCNHVPFGSQCDLVRCLVSFKTLVSRRTCPVRLCALSTAAGCSTSASPTSGSSW